MVQIADIEISPVIPGSLRTYVARYSQGLASAELLNIADDIHTIIRGRKDCRFDDVLEFGQRTTLAAQD